jgi:hypothetical protein
MNNVQVATAKDDARPAFWLNDVTLADFFRLKATVAPSASMFSLKNVSGFRISGSRGVKDMEFETSVTRII